MKNKILAILLVLAMCLSLLPMSVFAADNSTDLIITGGTEGTDYTYENGVLDIKAAGTYEIKNVDPATATGDIIKVSAPSGTVNITLSGVVINVSATDLAAFEITGECTTKLILKDGSENSLDSGVDRAGIANHSHNLIITCENAENATHICSSDCGVLRAIGQYYGAGIGGDSDESGSNIIITGGNIVADIVNSQGGAGIGGGRDGNGSNITIFGGTVTATSENGAGIGGGLFGSGSGITISGGTVTTTSVYGAGIGGGQGGNGSNITISGGTVAATSEQGAGIGGGELGDGSNITISGGTVTATSEQSAGIGGGAGGGIAGNIKIAPAANTRIYAYNGSDNTGTALTASPFTTETDITSLLSGSAFYSYTETNLIITGGTEGTNYTYENGVLDIKAAGTYEIKNADPTTATTDAIRVSAASGEVIVKLGGVNIEPTDKSAFEITGDCETTVVLKDGTENILDNATGTASSFAGLQNGEKVLTITCESSENTAHECTTDCGKLTAMGFWGAGIGGGNDGNGSNITISGGTVTATSEVWGAGIGGGYNGSGSNITISGGTVTATSEVWGAGIGGGYNGSGSNITISGGTVTATSEVWGAGIGGGNDGNGSNITISGGTVTATSEWQGAGIGGGYNGTANNIKIAPAANTRIYAYNGSDNTGTALTGSPFTTETDITSLLSGNAFYSESQCIHADTDTDHNCDFGCGETMGTHGDTNLDHTCDYGCADSIGTHKDSDTDADHVCDYGCGVTLENCTDAENDNNHTCDVCGKADVSTHTYGDATCEALATCSECGATTGDALGHKDDNKDHTCDRGCGKTDMGAHADSATDTDHLCDYGCGATLENCTDAVNDNNHSCDVCGKADVSEHTYGDATCEAPATCSECGATTGDALGHRDDNTDHTCDRGCGKTDMGAHAATSGKHTCDYCGAAVSICKDDDGNHICDICGAELTHDYSTEWKSDGTNHWHECSCGAKADEAAHSGGTASCTEKAKCVVCAVEYGELAAHTYGTEWKSDGTNHWHECTCGAKADETAHNGGTASCTDKAKCVVCAEEYGNLAAHTYEKGKCTVCEAADPNYVPESSSPQTGDNSNMALWIALLFISGGAVITLTAYNRKRRNTVKH